MMREGKEDIYESGSHMNRAEKEADAYDKYRELGGIINEKDYESALSREPGSDHKSQQYMLAAENIAEFAGIELKNEGGEADPRIKLFAVLRSYQKPGGTNHHGQMNDIKLFAEVLRMSDDVDSLAKLEKTYHKPGIHCPICLTTPASAENNCK